MNLKIILSLVALIVVVGVSFVFLYPGDSSKSMSDGSFDMVLNPAFAIASGNAYGPATIVDPNSGVLYLIYTQTHDDSTNLYLVSSDDNGGTFSEPVKVNHIEGDVTHTGSGGTPQIAIGHNGEVYIQWIKTALSEEIRNAGFTYGLTNINFARSLDGGKSFEPSIKITDGNEMESKHFHSLTVAPDGTIYSGFLDGRTVNNGDSKESTIRVARSIDGGSSFESSVVVDMDPCPCCSVHLSVSRDNVLYVSWRNIASLDSDVPEFSEMRNMVVARSTDGGKTFDVPSQINPQPNYSTGCVHVGAPIAVDNKGNLHTAWYVGAGNEPGIYYSVSSDGGKTFEKHIPILVDEWVPPSQVDLTIDENDNVWIAWENPLVDGGEAGDDNWRYENSYGMTQLTLITSDGQMSTTPLGEGKFPQLIAGDSLTFAAWGDDDTINFRTISMTK